MGKTHHETMISRHRQVREARRSTSQTRSEDFGVGVTTAWDCHQQMVGFFAEVLGCPDDELPALVAGKVCLVDRMLCRRRGRCTPGAFAR